MFFVTVLSAYLLIAIVHSTFVLNAKWADLKYWSAWMTGLAWFPFAVGFVTLTLKRRYKKLKQQMFAGRSEIGEGTQRPLCIPPDSK